MSTHGSGGAADPSAQDRGAGSEDVDHGTIVGEARAAIARGGGPDSAGGGLRRRGRVRGIGVLVAGRDSQENASPDERRGGAVNGRGAASAKGHVGDGTVGARASAGVRGDEVNSRNDARANAV